MVRFILPVIMLLLPAACEAGARRHVPHRPCSPSRASFITAVFARVPIAVPSGPAAPKGEPACFTGSCLIPVPGDPDGPTETVDFIKQFGQPTDQSTANGRLTYTYAKQNIRVLFTRVGIGNAPRWRLTGYFDIKDEDCETPLGI